MSLFGEVVLKREGYGRPGVSSLLPLDTQLNLPPNKHSHGLRQWVGQEVAKGSCDAAVDSVERTTGRKVPKRQAEELAAEVSQDLVAFIETRQSPGVELTADPLVMSADGPHFRLPLSPFRSSRHSIVRRNGLRVPLAGAR